MLVKSSLILLVGEYFRALSYVLQFENLLSPLKTNDLIEIDKMCDPLWYSINKGVIKLVIIAIKAGGNIKSLEEAYYLQVSRVFHPIVSQKSVTSCKKMQTNFFKQDILPKQLKQTASFM